MRVLSLNAWAGKEFETLIEYVTNKAEEIDVFCFQEVFDTSKEIKLVNGLYRANLFDELRKVLPNHKGYFAPAQDGIDFETKVDFQISWGISMFVRKNLFVKEVMEHFIKGEKNTFSGSGETVPRNLQHAIIEHEGKEYNIVHLHGLWNGRGKTDTQERIEQSEKIKRVIQGKTNLVLCGDFNLLPDTQSLKILEEGLTNLIKEYKITSTRSRFYEKPEKFADYTLVSKDINVKNFEVPNVDASDHLPMILDFS